MQPACILWAKCCAVSSHSFVSGCCWASPTCRHDDRLRPSWNILDSWSRGAPWCSVSTRGCFLNVYPLPLQMLWPCGDRPVLYRLLHTASLPTTSIKSITKILLGHTARVKAARSAPWTCCRLLRGPVSAQDTQYFISSSL